MTYHNVKKETDMFPFFSIMNAKFFGLLLFLFHSDLENLVLKMAAP